MKVQLLIVFALICLESIDAYCFGMNSCHDENAKKTYKDGDSWEIEKCTTCYCYVTKELQKICKVGKRSKSPEEVVLRSPFEISKRDERRCTEITEEEASELPKNAVTRYYVEQEFSSCCSRLFYPTGVHEECEKKLVIDKCMYEVVDKETGEQCKHPYGMVGK